MAGVKLSGWGIAEESPELHKLSSPLIFFWTMLIFLVIVAFLAAILFRQIQSAFVTNPGLNGLIFGVLLIGILLAFNQVIRLRPEVKWVNSLKAAGSAEKAGSSAAPGKR